MLYLVEQLVKHAARKIDTDILETTRRKRYGDPARADTGFKEPSLFSRFGNFDQALRDLGAHRWRQTAGRIVNRRDSIK